MSSSAPSEAGTSPRASTPSTVTPLVLGIAVLGCGRQEVDEICSAPSFPLGEKSSGRSGLDLLQNEFPLHHRGDGSSGVGVEAMLWIERQAASKGCSILRKLYLASHEEDLRGSSDFRGMGCIGSRRRFAALSDAILCQVLITPSLFSIIYFIEKYILHSELWRLPRTALSAYTKFCGDEVFSYLEPSVGRL